MAEALWVQRARGAGVGGGVIASNIVSKPSLLPNAIASVSLIVSLATLALTSPVLIGFWSAPSLELGACLDYEDGSTVSVWNSGRSTSEDVWLRFYVVAPERVSVWPPGILNASVREIGEAELGVEDPYKDYYRFYDLKLDFLPSGQGVSVNVDHLQGSGSYADAGIEDLVGLFFLRDIERVYSVQSPPERFSMIEDHCVFGRQAKM